MYVGPSGYATTWEAPILSCTASLHPKDYGLTMRRHSHVRWLSPTNLDHQRYQPCCIHLYVCTQLTERKCYRCISFGSDDPAKLSSTMGTPPPLAHKTSTRVEPEIRIQYDKQGANIIAKHHAQHTYAASINYSCQSRVHKQNILDP